MSYKDEDSCSSYPAYPMFKFLEVTLDVSGGNNRPGLELIATIIASIAYGIIICLFLQTLSMLVTNKTSIYTGTTRSILIIYTVVMFALSTLSVIQQITDIVSTVATTSSNIIKMDELFFLPLTIFGADGFMLWRSVILYQDASLPHRVFLYGLLIAISMGSLGSAILYYLAPQISTFALKSPFTPSIITISITTSLNFMLTTIIAGRLLYHQETMRRILGKEYRSPSMRVIVMLVESCSLIVVTGLIFLILVALGNMKRYNGCVIPYFLLPHVYVLSPLLIVYQVAKGRAIARTTVKLSPMFIRNISETTEEGLSYLQPIQFNHSVTRTSDENTIRIFEVAEFDDIKPECDGGSQL